MGSRIRLQAMKDYAFGIDIGGTTVKIGFFETSGTLVKSWEIPTRTEENGKYILSDIAAAIDQEISERGLSKNDIEGIGIDVPGPVLEDRIVNRCVHLGWGVFDVAEEMKKLTGIEKIGVANDANAATLGEMWQGGGKGHQELVMLTLGTGVGGGVIHQGRILSGVFGCAGEFGHICTNKAETRACGCGKYGHLEQYASATGIAQVARDMLEASDKPSLLRDFPDFTAKEVFDCAKSGDELALEIVDKAGDELGYICSVISCVFDPEIYVFGGGVSKAGDILIDTIRKHFKKYAFHACENAEFALASLGNDAGMYGAVKMVL